VGEVDYMGRGYMWGGGKRLASCNLVTQQKQCVLGGSLSV
jgi:hypothetical protein